VSETAVGASRGNAAIAAPAEPDLPVPPAGPLPARAKLVRQRARLAALLVCAASLATSLVLLLLYSEPTGAGDQLDNYSQAARLFPFVHNYYGPIYFAALRLVHDVAHVDWFTTAKLTAWLSGWAFLGLSYLLLKHLLGTPTSVVALALVAFNPTVIWQSYVPMTIMFGAAWVLGAIVLTLRTPSDQPARWVLPGLAFGIAYLTRFQALGFLIGAVAGLLVIPAAPLRTRATCAAWLLIGAALLPALWNVLLIWKQGYVPANYNFRGLTLALGQGRHGDPDWFGASGGMADLLRQYHNFWGVLTSHWSAPFRIAAFAAKEVVKFPFGVGFHLLFVATAWFLPGLVIAATRRDCHRPWLGAFLSGLVLTGIGSSEWTHYYLALIPIALVLIVYAVQSMGPAVPSLARRISWGIVVATTAVWSAVQVPSDFRNTNWPEFYVARKYIQATADLNTVISTTAGSFPYGTTIRFVRQQAIMLPEETDQLVDRLREHGVTRLVITERHTVDVYPALAYLLDDSVTHLPPGLRRDTLIVRPRRLAIYRVLPREAAAPPL
jgi:hypothetical protein